jgi:hypothetical protein
MNENEVINQFNQRLDKLLGLGSGRKISSGSILPTGEPTIQIARMLIETHVGAELQPPEDLHLRWMDATHRIKQNPIDQIKQSFIHSSGILTFRNLALVLAILVLIVACVRALITPRWEKTGIYWVYVTRQHLFTIYPPVVTPGGQESPLYTLSDVKNALGNEAKIPSWLPDGYKFDSVLWLDDVSKLATIWWMGPQAYRYPAFSEHGGIKLFVQSLLRLGSNLRNTIVTGWIEEVAPGSFKETKVNGLPALLVQGDWEDPPTSFWTEAENQKVSIELEWSKTKAIQLYWTDGEWFYHLIAPSNVSSQDLIRMAESAH